MDWNKEIKIPRPSLSGLRRLLNSGPRLSLKKPAIGRSSKVEHAAPSARGTSTKRSSIKGPSLSRPSVLSKGPEIKLPRLVTDLYADLRERHLLPLVVLLIAAMIGAPLLLGNGGEKKTRPAGVPASSASAVGGSTDSAFAVVPAARQLRSPEKRLGHRQPLDPFRVEKSKEGKAHGSTSAGGTTGAGEAASPTALEGSAISEAESQVPRNAEIKVSETAAGDKELTIKESTSSSSSTTPPTSASSGSGAGSTSGSSGTTSESTSPTAGAGGQGEVVGYTVDLKTGDPEGELTEENEVAPMTKLPTAKNPLVVFVGLSQDNKSALFLMTSEVTAYYGAVHCVVDAQACQMVELKAGHAALFEYVSGETEAKYKVVLEKIVPVTKAQASTERGVEKTVTETVREHPAEPQGENPSSQADSISAARRFSK